MYEWEHDKLVVLVFFFVLLFLGIEPLVRRQSGVHRLQCQVRSSKDSRSGQVSVRVRLGHLEAEFLDFSDGLVCGVDGRVDLDVGLPNGSQRQDTVGQVRSGQVRSGSRSIGCVVCLT